MPTGNDMVTSPYGHKERGTTMITNIEENLPHKVSETICINCKHRWIDVRPESVALKDCECPSCHQIGFVINTGDDLFDNEG